MIITAEQIEATAHEMSVIHPWGYEYFVKNEAGDWVRDNILVVNRERRQSVHIYMDARPYEIIDWSGKENG